MISIVGLGNTGISVRDVNIILNRFFILKYSLLNKADLFMPAILDIVAGFCYNTHNLWCLYND